MKLTNLNNNLSSCVDFVMENYTVDTNLIINFVISVSQYCYQDSYSYKCNKYYCSYFYSKVFRLLSFMQKVYKI